jgi:hypothetical protein
MQSIILLDPSLGGKYKNVVLTKDKKRIKRTEKENKKKYPSKIELSGGGKLNYKF